MAKSKNISGESTPAPKKRIAGRFDKQIKKFDDRMAKLRSLFGWGSSDAQTDLSRVCYGDLTGQFEHLIATAMAALGEAPMYALLVEDFTQLGGDFHLRRLCVHMYLAGKCSPARIDMAIFDAANPPLIPNKL